MFQRYFFSTFKFQSVSFLLFFFSSLLLSPWVWATEGCEPLLQGNSKKTKAISPRHVRLTIEELASPSLENPIVKYPTLVMNAAQKYHQILQKSVPYTTKDPVFRVKDVQVHPIFTDSMGLDIGQSITGQYEAVQAMVDYIATLARGDGGGKFLSFVGPAATGKTLLVKILDMTRAKFAQEDPAFYEFTFMWKNLDQVPALKPKLPRLQDQLVLKDVYPDVLRSPFTLLRSDIQEEVLSAVKGRVEEILGFHLVSWAKPAPQDKSIIEAIMAHEYKEIGDREKFVEDLSTSEYISALEKYVRIVPRPATDESDGIIRDMGPNPDLYRSALNRTVSDFD